MAGLTIDQKIELAQLETKIEKGLRAFYEAGQALALVRDEQMYGQTTFELYCEERWGMKRSQAYRLIDAAQVLQNLSPMGDIPLPQNERQARPMTKLPAEQQQTAWESALATSQKALPTSTEVKAAVVAVEAPKASWQPGDTTMVLSADEAVQVTIIEVDPKRPLVVCADADGKEKTYLTTQLEGHTPTPKKTAETPKRKPSDLNLRESLEATLQVESERLEIVEEAARILAIAVRKILPFLQAKELPTESELKAAVEGVEKLLGIPQTSAPRTSA